MRGLVGSTLNLCAQFAHDDAQVMRIIEVRTAPNLLWAVRAGSLMRVLGTCNA